MAPTDQEQTREQTQHFKSVLGVLDSLEQCRQTTREQLENVEATLDDPMAVDGFKRDVSRQWREHCYKDGIRYIETAMNLVVDDHLPDGTEITMKPHTYSITFPLANDPPHPQTNDSDYDNDSLEDKLGFPPIGGLEHVIPDDDGDDDDGGEECKFEGRADHVRLYCEGDDEEDGDEETADISDSSADWTYREGSD